ncbi:hydrogenase maturation protease [Ideonella sp. 4Y16]|uniref:Hydrogenase maturation protease n=1 Tax=Ideonella alba TaxID=2824118 RepID=A0A941BE06_9BURK|nr:hydrogenase maturation protease [Ideonella alba]MBQ0929462.1 hydrogenase maturation protease [Ideonella alba]MBQ0944564.1 hydrogenase maturation protease [Ideonella alba]
MRPPLLIGIGNPARGDDGLGPALVEALQTEPGLEAIAVFQLQVEDALLLADRPAVLFVDAARPGHAGDGVQLRPISAQPDRAPISHALQPEALLAVARDVLGQAPPPAALLAIEGEHFGLGEGLSGVAAARMPVAQALVRDWLTRAVA